MPEARAGSGVFRRWRLPALLTSITLVGGAALVRSTVARLHDQVAEVRGLRARLAERRREIERQRQELAAVAMAVDALVPPARALESRAAEACLGGGPEGRCDVLPEAVSTASPRADDGTAAEAARSIVTLAWVEEQVAKASDAFAAETLLATRLAEAARSVPTLWPLRGAVSSPFGWRRSPYGGGPEWHPGVDILAPYGTPVHATADGEVAFAGRSEGYGALVVVDHGAATTRYAHLSAIWVRPGQRVLRGETLGAVGGTGRATAPHLHYEVRFGSEALDPTCLLAPDGITLASGGRRSRACALVRARFEDPRSRVPPPDAAHATPPRSSAAG